MFGFLTVGELASLSPPHCSRVNYTMLVGEYIPSKWAGFPELVQVILLKVSLLSVPLYFLEMVLIQNGPRTFKNREF